MYPPHEHAFYIWMIIIGAVSLFVLVGAIIDRFFLYRHFRRIKVLVNDDSVH